jgi:5-methylcytosine-specific restriction endonuclease McrA
MGVTGRHHRFSADVIRSPRWKAIRLQAKRRDGFACVQCGSRNKLEVDHIKPVRSAPELAFALGNLQTLCAGCHARKTRIEVGMPDLSAPRRAWRELVLGTAPSLPKKENKTCSTQ